MSEIGVRSKNSLSERPGSHEQDGAARTDRDERIAVIGLGYVGLPVAVAFADKFPGTIGFDVSESRISELSRGVDRTREVSSEKLSMIDIVLTNEPSRLSDRTLFVVAVPTPIDHQRRPDLAYIRAASEIVGSQLRPGAIVVYESTVYPGVTEEFCVPVLEEVSGLRCGIDFKVGYSPERINPGDREHVLERIVKVVSGQDEESLERIASAYEAIVQAGVYRAPSIKVAEAAKVIENTQRDLNIALMNELVVIFDRLGINTTDVLEAAGTKWNFLPFKPGLVGGHCIGVDPYYLTSKAEEVGYNPQVILAGRRINDDMGIFVAQKLIKLLSNTDIPVRQARVAVLGLTFKENVPDLRNSRVPDIVKELREFGIEPMVHDPLVDPAYALEETGLTVSEWNDLHQMDALILAVAHEGYAERICGDLGRLVRQDGIIVDIKGMLRRLSRPESLTYWSF